MSVLMSSSEIQSSRAIHLMIEPTEPPRRGCLFGGWVVTAMLVGLIALGWSRYSSNGDGIQQGFAALFMLVGIVGLFINSAVGVVVAIVLGRRYPASPFPRRAAEINGLFLAASIILALLLF